MSEVGGCLAMSPGHGNAVLQPHQLGQHLGSANHRDAESARCRHFLVLFADRRRDHQQVGVADVILGVTDVDPDPQLFEPAGRLAGHQVGTGDLEIDLGDGQDLGDATHPRTADAGRSGYGTDRRSDGTFSSPPAGPRPDRPIAPRRPDGLKLERYDPSRPTARGSANSASSFAASSSTPSPSCIISAPPASTSARAFAPWCPAAMASGIRTEGRPTAEISARVMAPARDTTRLAQPSASATSSRKEVTSTRFASRVPR